MKIAYTVCTLNRLGQILVLGKSLLQHNPDYHFIIGLADEVNERINVEQYKPFEFISLSQIDTPDKNKLTEQYDLFELSCALKAYYGEYIIKKYEPEIIFYFDTDMQIYHSLDILENLLKTHSILLTPHITSELPLDGKYLIERDVIRSGLYNAGFIGLKNDNNTKSFVTWWKNHLSDEGYNNICNGMMVDQLWLNLVPLLFKGVLIVTDPGCNFAYWNMHERFLSVKENSFFVNDKPLIFFHFSGYRIDNPNKLSIYQNRFSISKNIILQKLFKQYYEALTLNNFKENLLINPIYGKKLPPKRPSFPKRTIVYVLKGILYRIEK